MVHVCQQSVCVDQRLAIPVVDIVEVDGSDCTFARVDVNGFRADDSVEGWSDWSGTIPQYHRHSRTRDGQIVVLASTQLVANSVVKGIGARFVYLGEGGNSIWAHGKDPAGKPPSEGTVWAYYQVRVTALPPVGAPQILYTGAKTRYEKHGPIDSNVGAIPNFVSANNDAGARELYVPLSGSFIPQTIFTLQIDFSYVIKGKGEEGEAAVHHSLKVEPFIAIEACTYEYPDAITINLAEYL